MENSMLKVYTPVIFIFCPSFDSEVMIHCNLLIFTSLFHRVLIVYVLETLNHSSTLFFFFRWKWPQTPLRLFLKTSDRNYPAMSWNSWLTFWPIFFAEWPACGLHLISMLTPTPRPITLTCVQLALCWERGSLRSQAIS